VAKRKATAAPSNVFQLPHCGKLDVRDALLSNRSMPTVKRPPELDAAIEAKARAMADEAYQLCLEHLRRRVASRCEWSQPRQLDLQGAFQVIGQGDLGDALTTTYRTKLRYLVHSAESAARISDQFREFADDVRNAVKVEL